MGEANGSDDEVTAVERAAQIVEGLRATGSYETRYHGEQERAVLQRAGRIARATVKPRKMTARTFNGVFLAYWVDPTPLEKQIQRARLAEAVNAVQPRNWQQRLRRRGAP
ncbi:Uncharacterised protein [Mycobacterium tuberculosis]|nr:Uncharacterised protein [Mycobacterium tuberculosis]